MKNNGFTLVELLGVIIILALLTILVFPSIINSVKSSGEKTDALTLDMIYRASELYISNHKSDFIKKEGNKYVISLKDLVAEDLLASPIKLSDSDIDITNTKSVQVIYSNGKFTYELKNSGECVEEVQQLLCEWIDSNNDDNYTYGEVVMCDTEKFYILSSDINSVKLFADKNISLSLTNPVQSDNSEYIQFASSNYWWNSDEEELNENYQDNDYYVYLDSDGVANSANSVYPYVEAYKSYLSNLGFDITDARLISKEEAVWCTDPDCYPIWDVGTQAYWTGTLETKGGHQDTQVKYVDDATLLIMQNEYTVNITAGIRPVIIVSKTGIEKAN